MSNEFDISISVDLTYSVRIFQSGLFPQYMLHDVGNIAVGFQCGYLSIYLASLLPVNGNL